jgi:hypothetical protein
MIIPNINLDLCSVADGKADIPIIAWNIYYDDLGKCCVIPITPQGEARNCIRSGSLELLSRNPKRPLAREGVA